MQEQAGHTIIEVNVGGNSAIDLSDFIDSVKIIKLKTSDEALVGSISKIQYVSGKLYVLDQKQNCIFVFNEDGSFENKLDKHGTGPGEYVTILDFTIADDTIYVQDFVRKLVLLYSSDFQFIGQVNYQTLSNNLMVADGGIWLYKEPSNPLNDYMFIHLDKGRGEQGFLKRTDKKRHPYNWSGVFAFAKSTECAYASPRHGNEIYKIDGGILHLIYEIDFKGHNFPKNQNVNDYDIYSPDFAYALKHNVFMTDHFVIFDYWYGGNYAMCFYNTIDKTAHCGTVINDMLGGFPFIARWGNDNILISEAWPQLIKAFPDMCKYDEQLSGMNDDDNPAIILYRLK